MRSGDIERLEENISAERTDVVNVSPKGRVMSMIEVLMNNKQQLKDRKDELIGNTLAAGTDYDNIKDIVKQYDEQIAGIDEQIDSLMQEELQRVAEEKDEKESEPLTAEEAEQKQLNNIVFSSGDIEQMKVIDSAKNALRRRINVLSSEIKLDAGHALPSKLDEVKELERRVDKASADLAEASGDVIDEAKDEIKVPPIPTNLTGSLQPTEETIRKFLERQAELTADAKEEDVTYSIEKIER